MLSEHQLKNMSQLNSNSNTSLRRMQANRSELPLEDDLHPPMIYFGPDAWYFAPNPCPYDDRIPLVRLSAPQSGSFQIGPHYNTSLSNVDIDMVSGRGPLSMLDHLLTSTSVNNVGGYVEKQRFANMTCISKSPYELWIPSEEKKHFTAQFATFRKGYVIESSAHHMSFDLEFKMIGSDLLTTLKNASISEIIIYMYGMKASLEAGTEFMESLRLGNKDCVIDYDIALNVVPPPELISAGHPVSPLTRLDATNVKKLGLDKCVENLPHTYSVQVAACATNSQTNNDNAGENDDPNDSLQKHAIPSYGSFNIESKGREQNVQSNLETPLPEADDMVEGHEHFLRAKCYSTLHHGATAKTRVNASTSHTAPQAKNYVQTMSNLSLSKLVNSWHYLRIELSMKLHDRETAQVSCMSFFIMYFILCGYRFMYFNMCIT